MKLQTYKDQQAMGQAAAAAGAEKIRKALAERGEANIIVATGASQFEMLSALIKAEDIAWDKVTIFHLDEYLGISISHPASFRRYLWERLHSQLPVPVKNFHYIDAESDPETECKRLNALIEDVTIDVCFCGIGENAHLAFNDPPADFDTTVPYLIVELDETCRNQQLAEGWFPTMNDVPKNAISMSVRQMLKSSSIICTIPTDRKAEAVLQMVEHEISPMIPATILREHADCGVFLDEDAASLLKQEK